MMVTAESTQERDLSAGKTEIAAARGGAVEVARRKTKKPRPAAGTEFRGVRALRSGMYGAQIWDPWRRTNVWIGTYATAKDSARAYAAAAVELRGSAAKNTNLKVGDGIDVGLEKAAASSVLRGVYQQQSKVAYDPVQRARVCLGIVFDTAEDAASAYRAAAVEVHDASAVTSFKQPPTDATADEGEESTMFLTDFPEMLPLNIFSDSTIPGAQLDDLFTDLPKVELQPVDELLQDMDFTGVAC
jgi:hypothetical protein